MSQGQTGFVPGTRWVWPRDEPRFSPYFTQWKPSLSLGQTQFVPGTFRGRRAAERVYVLKVYVPFSFPKKGRENHQKTRIFYPCRTPKIPGKEGKNAQENKEILAGEKEQGIQKKTRKGSTGFEVFAALAHRSRCDFCAICDCDAHRGPQKSRAISERREMANGTAGH